MTSPYLRYPATIRGGIISNDAESKTLLYMLCSQINFFLITSNLAPIHGRFFDPNPTVIAAIAQYPDFACVKETSQSQGSRVYSAFRFLPDFASLMIQATFTAQRLMPNIGFIIHSHATVDGDTFLFDCTINTAVARRFIDINGLVVYVEFRSVSAYHDVPARQIIMNPANAASLFVHSMLVDLLMFHYP